MVQYKIVPGRPARHGSHPGRAGSEAGLRPAPRPPGIALSPLCDPAPGGLYTHHPILYAGLGGTSSARSDEQPRAGVDPKRVQRERGPVQLWRPAPTHPARRALHCLRRGPRDMPRPAFDCCPGRCGPWPGCCREDSRSFSHPPSSRNSNHTVSIPNTARGSLTRSRRPAARRRTEPALLAQAQSRRYASALACLGLAEPGCVNSVLRFQMTANCAIFLRGGGGGRPLHGKVWLGAGAG